MIYFHDCIDILQIKVIRNLLSSCAIERKVVHVVMPVDWYCGGVCIVLVVLWLSSCMSYMHGDAVISQRRMKKVFFLNVFFSVSVQGREEMCFLPAKTQCWHLLTCSRQNLEQGMKTSARLFTGLCWGRWLKTCVYLEKHLDFEGAYRTLFDIDL